MSKRRSAGRAGLFIPCASQTGTGRLAYHWTVD